MMRLLLLGAGQFGVPTFDYLHKHHEVAALVSQPDRPAGRNRQLTPADAAKWAQDNDVPVLKTDDVNDPAFIAQIQALKVDASVVIAFGQKISPQFIEVAGKLIVNLHSSLLPKFRGAAPINWAILKGEKETGVCVIALAQQMDAGLIYNQVQTPIAPQETAGELHDRLSALGPEAVSSVLNDLASGTLQGKEQDATLATRAPKLSKANCPVDFSQSAVMVRNHVHGLTPWPGATILWHRSNDQAPCPLFLRRVQVVREIGKLAAPGIILGDGTVACGEGSIKLLEVQQPGKRQMTFEEFSRGNKMSPGDRLAPG